MKNIKYGFIGLDNKYMKYLFTFVLISLLFVSNVHAQTGHAPIACGYISAMFNPAPEGRRCNCSTTANYYGQSAMCLYKFGPGAVTVNLGTNYPGNYEISPITSAWDQSTVYWGNKPTVGATSVINVPYDTPISLPASTHGYQIFFNDWALRANIQPKSNVFDAGPVYGFNDNVASSAGGLLGSLVSVVFTSIPVAIGIVGGLVVTKFGIGCLIGFARSHIHG